MQIRSFCGIPVEADEPAAAIRQFVRILRTWAVPTPGSKLDMNLVATSATGKAVIQRFDTERTASAPFEDALRIAEELTELPPGKMRTLHIHVSAEGFHWKGSTASTSGKLLLMDMKVFQRKRRFGLTASMDFETASPTSTEVSALLSAVKKETGLEFTIKASTVQFEAGDRQQATTEQFLVAHLAWNELIDVLGQTLRPAFNVTELPQLMSADATLAYNFDAGKLGKAERVDFKGIVRRWLKQNFADYQVGRDDDWHFLVKQVAPQLVLSFRFDKKPGAFSKNYSAWLGIELSAREFATMPERPYRLSADLFEAFELFMYKWAYFTEQELHSALNGSRSLIEAVLKFMEREAPVRFQNVLHRKPEEFEGPREISARAACELVSSSVKAWAGDAELNTVQLLPLAVGVDARVSELASPSGQGRSGPVHQWRLIFHSSKKQEKLQVFVPWRGAVRRSRFSYASAEASGLCPPRAFPDNWTDSGTALERALTRLRSLEIAAIEPSQFEMRYDHQFGQAWHLIFQDKQADGGLALTHVSLPAYGDGEIKVSTTRFNHRGMPTQ